jgi:hypothetical protein
VPFAFMTAYSPSYIRKPLGFVAVLAKPFDELLAMVARLPRRDVPAATSTEAYPSKVRISAQHGAQKFEAGRRCTVNVA